MKKPLLIISAIVFSTSLFAQQQIANGDLENWEGVSSGEEPVDWNGFMTASGAWSWAAAAQVESSTDTRPGTSGSMSARIWTRDTGFGLAQGNLTIGRINMGSTNPSDADNNYNYTVTTDPDFSQAITDSPDSIVFWVKYTAANGGSNARMKATLHDDFEYHDPEGSGSSADHAHAYAELDYAPTNGWVRKSVPFNYTGTATSHAFLLVTFASNNVPGGGDVNDEVLIDDIELIYNVDAVNEINDLNAAVSYNADLKALTISADNMNGEYELYDLSGKSLSSGTIQNKIAFDQPNGMYLVLLRIEGKTYSFKVLK